MSFKVPESPEPFTSEAEVRLARHLIQDNLVLAGVLNAAVVTVDSHPAEYVYSKPERFDDDLLRATDRVASKSWKSMMGKGEVSFRTLDGVEALELRSNTRELWNKLESQTKRTK